MIDNSKEYILCAAIRRKTPLTCEPYYVGTNDICNIEIGYRHHDIYQRFNDRETYPDYADCPLSIKMEDQGFYTSKGRFVDRYEAMELAYLAGQVSEDTALNKRWYKPPCQMYDEEGNLIDEEYSRKRDTHKYNMLFSEDLY